MKLKLIIDMTVINYSLGQINRVFLFKKIILYIEASESKWVNSISNIVGGSEASIYLTGVGKAKV